MPRRKEWFGLPDGTFTQDVKKMAKAWRTFAAPIAKATGMQTSGYDPGVSWFGTGHHESLHLDSWIIKRLNKALCGNEMGEL